MCAACVMAGHTKESYQAYYDKHSRNRPMPRKSTGGKRPRKQLRPHAVQRNQLEEKFQENVLHTRWSHHRKEDLLQVINTK